MPLNNRIVVSIGGGHGAGVTNVSSLLKQSLIKLFPSLIKIKIVNMDELVIDTTCRKYSEQDYNFAEIYEKLVEPISLEDNSNTIEIVILCGSYALFNDKINEISKLKIFLDTDGDDRLINLIHLKNAADDKESLALLLQEYLENMRPEMEKNISPTKKLADLIIPHMKGSNANTDNDNIGLEIIVDGVVKIIEHINDKNGNSSMKRISSSPLWDFQTELLNVEKDRYYDLS
ncbi:hypothetical protein NCAS_0A10420 [Naumovozyma castellii]|uniref:Phosphoribulokinase/uridine kinase domain-containing protein n=1 Tax=Naumovozyma castellii TaxID=27288 RepID=G0V802_NAUCA|nr:hypothetical protein NCAS_0A10420 [Naumovozyma castellii CBS 4309]CCC67600.1 hypothetical protein NCAS_0A10420 [Naumovozyma castellii CBS 4309]